MKRLIAILICAIIVSMCSTNNSPIYRTGKTALFYATISDYCMPDRAYCSYCNKTNGEFMFAMQVVGESCATVYDVLYGEANAERYFEFQARYNDYPKVPMFIEHWNIEGWISSEPYFVTVEDITKIEITALENWNENYPKGSDLSGIFTFSYQSPKAYIESGFTTDMDETFTCKVDEISTSPIELLRCGMTYLTTTELPTAERSNVNIKYYFSNGDILECQTLSNFVLP